MLKPRGEEDPGGSRRWRLVIIGIFAVGLSLVALTVFSQIFPFSAQPESVPVPLDSGLNADYGTDPQTFRIPAFRPEIITDIARDTNTEIPARHATLLANILTPGENPVLPTPTPSSAPPRPTPVPTDEPPPPPPVPTATATPGNPEPPETPPGIGTPTPTLDSGKPTKALPTIAITLDPTYRPWPTPTLEEVAPTPLPPKPTALPSVTHTPTP